MKPLKINLFIIFIFFILKIFHLNFGTKKYIYNLLTFFTLLILIGLIICLQFLHDKDYIKYILFYSIILFIYLLDGLRTNKEYTPTEESANNFDIGHVFEKTNYKVSNYKVIQDPQDPQNPELKIWERNKITDWKGLYNWIIFFILSFFICYKNIFFINNKELTDHWYNAPNKFQFNEDSYKKLDFEGLPNINYLFIFMFFTTFIPNLTPKDFILNSYIESIICFIFFVYLIYESRLYTKYIHNFLFDLFKDNNYFKDNFVKILITFFIIPFIIIFFLITDSSKNNYEKYNNFRYFFIIMICFLMIFLLKNDLFDDPFKVLGNFMGIHGIKFIFIFIALFFLYIFKMLYDNSKKKIDDNKCTKENIKKNLLKIYDHYNKENPLPGTPEYKNKLEVIEKLKQFVLIDPENTNPTELKKRLDNLNPYIDADGCFNYTIISKLLIRWDTRSADTIPLYVSIIIWCLTGILIIILVYLYHQTPNIVFKDPGVIVIGIIFIILMVSSVACLINLYIDKQCNLSDYCEYNKSPCSNDINPDYKMNFEISISTYIALSLVFLLVIIILLIIYISLYPNGLPILAKLFEKDRLFIISFVIIIILCSFLLFLNNTNILFDETPNDEST